MSRWKPGAGRTPSFDEARGHVAHVEASPHTRYERIKSTPERVAVTGRAPGANAEQGALFPDETSRPEMVLDHHDDSSPARRATNEKKASEFAGRSIDSMRRQGRYTVDSALAAGRSDEFYMKTARNQVGLMAQRTGVDFQTGAATAAATSPQKPWMLGAQEHNVELAEAVIETTIRDKGLGRQEKYKPHAEWDAMRDADRDYRYENVLKPMLPEMTDVVKDKATAVVEHGAAGGDPIDAHWGGMDGTGNQPVFGSGLKETSFYQNFRQPGNPRNRVTFDKHMSDDLVGPEKGSQFRTGPARYRIGAQAFGRAAVEAGVTPEGGQAAAWTHVKEGKGHGGGLYDESGEGLSYAQRQEIADMNPPLFKQRNNEYVPNNVSPLNRRRMR